MITVDDLLLPRRDQQLLGAILEDAHRRKLGTYAAGRFVPHPGREQHAAEFIEAAVLHLGHVVAEHLDLMRGGSVNTPTAESILTASGLPNDAHADLGAPPARVSPLTPRQVTPFREPLTSADVHASHAITHELRRAARGVRRG